MKRILEFLKSNQYAVIWTVCYVAVMWAILSGLFGFDMFVASDWNRLMRAHLRGFAGFVFGILILAALPLYVATTVLVVRNKALLFTVPVPDAVKQAAKKLIPAKKTVAAADATPAPVAEEKDTPEKKEDVAFPEIMPSELRGAFVRARQHIGATPKSNFDTAKMVRSATTAAKMPELIPVGVDASVAQLVDDVPLPADFDFGADDGAADNAFGMDVPMFKDIEFVSDTTAEADAAPATMFAPTDAPVRSLVQMYLDAHNIESMLGEDGLVYAPNMVIATHDDAAFWIADDTAWFATGAQKVSPIAALHAGAVNGAQKVLYLAQSNIMDIDALRQKWTADGILVIDNLDALPI